MLTGSDLLAKVKELGDVSKSDLVRSCGYVGLPENVTSRPGRAKAALVRGGAWPFMRG